MQRILLRQPDLEMRLPFSLSQRTRVGICCRSERGRERQGIAMVEEGRHFSRSFRSPASAWMHFPLHSFSRTSSLKSPYAVLSFFLSLTHTRTLRLSFLATFPRMLHTLLSPWLPLLLSASAADSCVNLATHHASSKATREETRE